MLSVAWVQAMRHAQHVQESALVGAGAQAQQHGTLQQASVLGTSPLVQHMPHRPQRTRQHAIYTASWLFPCTCRWKDGASNTIKSGKVKLNENKLLGKKGGRFTPYAASKCTVCKTYVVGLSQWPGACDHCLHFDYEVLTCAVAQAASCYTRLLTRLAYAASMQHALLLHAKTLKACVLLG